MEVDYDMFEIVSVFRGFSLIDSESFQRNYQTGNNLPLAIGYYVVNWPAHVKVRRFDESAYFHGPFARRTEAKSVLHQLLLKYRQ